MELFSISCTTCQKRLSVRDRSVIGEILICPNCGSMVLVSPPEDWNPHMADEDCDTVDEIEPPELTEPIFRREQLDQPAHPPPLVRPPARPAAEPWEDVEDPFEQPPPIPEPPVDSEVPVESEAGEPLAPPRLPDEGWVSPVVQRRRQWLLTGAAAVVGVAMSLILVGFWASRNGDVSRGPASPATAEQVIPMPDDASPDAQEPASADATVDSSPGAQEASGPKIVPPDDAGDDPANPETMAPEMTEEPAPSPPADGDPPAADAPPHDTAPADLPLPKKTEVASEAEASQETAPDGEPAAKEPPDASALTRTLQSFAPFMRDEPYRPNESADSQDNVEPMPDIEEWDEQAGDQSSVPRPEPRDVNITERLQDTIPALDIPGMPLNSFTHFMTGLTTIPISLDPDALALLRIESDRAVAVKAMDTDVGGILTAALGPLGLDYLQVDGQLLVTRVAPDDGQLRSIRHSVGDLVGDSAQQLDQLVEWITTMIEPDSWDSQGGPGVLQAELPDLLIQHQDTVLLRVLLFCERLRVARGLPTKTKLDPELIRLDLRFQRAQPLLEKPIRIRYDEPVLMLQVLQQVTRETDLQILLDWQALAQMGWSPEAEAVLVADGVPVGEALTDMLQPMDLTYRVIDAKTVQVTSLDADQNRWDIEFHSLDPLLDAGADAGALIDRLAESAQQASLGPSDGVFQYDAASRHLIAALSQPHQRWLTDLLSRWEADAP